MPLDFNIVVGGEAGQGIQSVSFVLSKAMMRGGYGVYEDQEFESRIRGGHSIGRIRIADRPVRSYLEKANILLAMNRETIELHRGEMKPDGESVIVYDKEKMPEDVVDKTNLLDVPMERLAVEITGNKVMANTVAVGAAMGLVEYDFDILAGVLRSEFARLGEKVAEENVKAARAGYDYGKEHCPPTFKPRIKPIGTSKKLLISGHEAVALGAMAAGCKFVAGYPMTPTTSILEYLAENGRDFGIKVVQTEDEVSAVNMIIGAAYAGARAMTATSGGGFSLMVEGMSLAGMTETPIVVVLGMRPGPAIGLPTRTEQGDLWFALNAGHGEYPRALLAPSGAEDGFWLMVKAFNIAEKYQIPVTVLTDHDLADAYTTIDRFDFGKVTIERGDIVRQSTEDYKRYAFTDSGVSPRALPLMGNGLVVADSDEHTVEGHITEDAVVRTNMVKKRMSKMEGVKQEISKPYVNRRPGAKATLVGWGSTFGAIAEAQEILEKDGMPVNFMHLTEIWPFPAEAVAAELGDSIPSVMIESNATAQMARLIRMETGLKTTANILKFDGRPFSAQYIVEHLKKVI